MATQILVNIGSGDGLLPVVTGHAPEPTLTRNHRDLVAFAGGVIHMQ